MIDTSSPLAMQKYNNISANDSVYFQFLVFTFTQSPNLTASYNQIISHICPSLQK